MKRQRKSLELEINQFIDYWSANKMIAFLRDIIPLFELYDVEDEDDWVEKEVGGDEENVRTIRLIRTVYLMSKIADFHTGVLLNINSYFKELWKRMDMAAESGRGIHLDK